MSPEGDTKGIELHYPRQEGHAKYIQVGLEDVRAADDIRISYDFDRDGWVIEQSAVWTEENHDTYTEDWKEVAFVQAWGREGEAKNDR
jgi:hypothetical protein